MAAFTTDSAKALATVFKFYADQQKALPGGLGLGELGTNALVTLCVGYAGFDAVGEMFSNTYDRLLARTGEEDPFVRMNMNSVWFRMTIWGNTPDLGNDPGTVRRRGGG